MAEKYQARSNSFNEGAEIPEKSEKELRQESGARVANMIYKGLAEKYVPGVGGKLVDMASKTKLGQHFLNNSGKSLAQNPIAGRVAKKADDSELVNKADRAMDTLSKNPNGLNDNVDKKIPNSEDLDNKQDQLKDNNSESKFNLFNKNDENNNSFFSSIFGNNKKFALLKTKYVLIGGGVFLFLLLFFAIVASAKDPLNLDLTSGAQSTITSNNNSTVNTLNIEKKLVYLGDSRIVGMQTSLNNSNINYIAEEGMGYDWLKNTASIELDKTIQNNSDVIVVLSLGVNDLYNIDNYITYYNELMTKYSDTTFFVLSVNPVDETLTSSNGYSVTNTQINEFNEKLKASFSENYIDSNSSLSNVGTSDGLHYDNDTNKNIHNLVISGISKSGKVKGGQSGDLAVSLETVAMWYIENVDTYQRAKSGKGTGKRKYYQTPFGTRKFGDDCTEFAAAYMSYVSGVDITESWSGGMVNPNDSWAQSVKSSGWVAYASDNIDSLQLGDILIASSGNLYSDKGRHAEIYINESQTFGWGSIKSSYPTSNSIKRSEESGHVHFRDGGHDYITIYRYEGV